ncbi:MAG: polymer-forming cytoskeletal protein [Deltaproteobacteria bacterium]|nr:polymer-forming cytoskeletal protein [Deltaproteobacteria bacterium]
MTKRKREGEVTVFLGGDSQLEGVLTFHGQARLDGAFRGEIRGDGLLMVGPEAKIEATVEAAAVVVSGSVKGDVVASERIELRTPGRLMGNITAPLVVMDEGVLFEGHCRMADGSADERAAKVRLISEGGAKS